jgi:imidazolonepropionase-like amidohydrolase
VKSMVGALGTQIIYAARLIDGTGKAPLESPAIRIDGNVIKEIGVRGQLVPPPGAELRDLGSLSVMPGMIDAHTHLFGVPGNQLHLRYVEAEGYRALAAASQARSMLAAGITSARCCGSAVTPSLRRAINEGYVAGPRLAAAGQFICTTAGGWDPDQSFRLPLAWAKAEGILTDGVDELIAAVRARIRSGSTFIKIATSKGDWNDTFGPWGDDPSTQVLSMRPEEIAAVISEAHTFGVKVAAHAIGDAPVRAAVEHGADTIEHGFGIGDETRQLLVDRRVIVVSTLLVQTIMQEQKERLGLSASDASASALHLEAQRVAFEKGLAAGVRYALGSDLIGAPAHPQSAFPREFEVAASYGMTPLEAIKAGTLTGAEALGMSDIVGTLEPGKLADIVAVDGDPSKDISSVRRVKFVMQDGKVFIDPAHPELPEAGASLLATPRL